MTQLVLAPFDSELKLQMEMFDLCEHNLELGKSPIIWEMGVLAITKPVHTSEQSITYFSMEQSKFLKQTQICHLEKSEQGLRICSLGKAKQSASLIVIVSKIQKGTQGCYRVSYVYQQDILDEPMLSEVSATGSIGANNDKFSIKQFYRQDLLEVAQAIQAEEIEVEVKVSSDREVCLVRFQNMGAVLVYINTAGKVGYCQIQSGGIAGEAEAGVGEMLCGEGTVLQIFEPVVVRSSQKPLFQVKAPGMEPEKSVVEKVRNYVVELADGEGRIESGNLPVPVGDHTCKVTSFNDSVSNNHDFGGLDLDWKLIGSTKIPDLKVSVSVGAIPVSHSKLPLAIHTLAFELTLTFRLSAECCVRLESLQVIPRVVLRKEQIHLSVHQHLRCLRMSDITKEFRLYLAPLNSCCRI